MIVWSESWQSRSPDDCFVILWWIFLPDYCDSLIITVIIWFLIFRIVRILIDDHSYPILDYLMIIVIIWLWLFDNCDDYLLLIWWLFFRILDYLMIIWCLFDCSFVQARCCAHSSAAAISLSCWACLHCGLQTIGNLKPGGDGVADTESSTGLCFGAPLLRFSCGGTICLIPGHERRPAIRRNPPLLLVAEGLLWKLPAKMRKWSAKDLNIVCRIHAFPQALSTTSRKDAWGAIFTTPQKDTLTRHEATRALWHPCAHS